MEDKHKNDHIEFYERTLGGWLEHWAEDPNHKNKDFMVYPDRNLRYTYESFNNRVNQIAKGLLKLGIKQFDRIGIWASNVPDWLTFQFAAAKIGAVTVTINTAYQKKEIEYILKDAQLKAICLIDGWKGNNYFDILYSVAPRLKYLRQSPNSDSFGLGMSEKELYNYDMLFDPNRAKFPILEFVINMGAEKRAGMYCTSEIILLGRGVSDEELKEAERKVSPYHVVNIQYTSGTTGFPKGVMLTHVGITNNGYSIGHRQHFSEKERLCLPPPLFHCFGIVLGVMAILTHGATLIMIENFDPELVLFSIQAERATALYGVPTMFIAIMSHPKFKEYDLKSLHTGIMAGSLCPIETMKEVMEKMYMKDITIVYGLTEASPGMTQSWYDDDINTKAETVGRVFPYMSVKVMKPGTNIEVPDGEQGEMCVSGYNVMAGYFTNTKATNEVVTYDEVEDKWWLHSGDLGVKDPKTGNFRITGRIKDMIIRGGENIYPREIEEFLYTMPEIKDVQVVGVPSPKYGEQVGAYIILREGCTLNMQQVRDYCIGEIARYKIPKYVFFVKEFPLNAAGKILKYKLKEMSTMMCEQYGYEIF
ncbi:MAG: AMP-binding protein [Bacteroidales bacterium]|nr:AMP-binding protein [Bacteroidales bacterium]